MSKIAAGFNLSFLLAWGFRPFFILASISAILLMLFWSAFLMGLYSWPMSVAPVFWHGHEMVFGFATAAVCGFLLTAVPSWCGQSALASNKLLGLIGLFVIGRICMAAGNILPIWLVASINLAFLPLLLCYLAPILYRDSARRHLVFIAILVMYWLAQCSFYMALTFFEGDFAMTALNAGAYVLVFAIIVTVSRISMLVINVALKAQGETLQRFRPAPFRSNMAAAMFLLFALFDTFFETQAVTAWVALAAATAQLDRLRDWHLAKVLFKPYVAVLYLANLWIAIALIGLATSYLLDTGSANSWRHGFYIGAMGAAIIGVFSIAGLRHSGFKLIFSKMTVLAIILLFCAAFVRVLSDYYILASALWISAFCCYLAVYFSILSGLKRAE